jgi:hypothetical protein
MNAPILRPALIAAAALAMTGCASDGYRHHYGYAGLSYGYASPYYGWYDGFYYPGSGYYVYERSGTRHRWNDAQRHYWESRGGNRHHRDNWSGYRGSPNRGHDNDWNGNRQHRDHDGDRDRSDHRRHRR